MLKQDYRGYNIDVVKRANEWVGIIKASKPGMAMPTHSSCIAATREDALSQARHRVDELLAIVA